MPTEFKITRRALDEARDVVRKYGSAMERASMEARIRSEQPGPSVEDAGYTKALMMKSANAAAARRRRYDTIYNRTTRRRRASEKSTLRALERELYGAID